MAMEIREALRIIGVDRVRRAMEAFTHPSQREWCNCFCGEAFRDERRDEVTRAFYGDAAVQAMPRLLTDERHTSYAPISLWVNASSDMAVLIRRGRAIDRLSWAYESDEREQLYAECVAFLAEHGEAVEPSLAAVTPGVA